MDKNEYLSYIFYELSLLSANKNNDISPLITSYYEDAGLLNIFKKKHYLFWVNEVLIWIDRNINTSKKLIDLGAGTGTFSLYALFNGIDVDAYDIDAKALEILETRYSLARFLYPENSFGKLKIINAEITQDIKFDNYDIGICVFALLMMNNSEKIAKSLSKACQKSLFVLGNENGFFTKFVKKRSLRISSQKTAKQIFDFLNSDSSLIVKSPKSLFWFTVFSRRLGLFLNRNLPSHLSTAMTISTYRKNS